MAFTDPMLFGMLAALLIFFFFIYLMIRRTLVGFQEGVDKGQGRE